jgi:ubiquitin carboxyl-terminal hydrolase 8
MLLSAATVKNDADVKYLSKDFEKAYVLLGRYFHILMKIQNRRDYDARWKEALKLKLGPNAEQKRLMDMMEHLQGKFEAEENAAKAAAQQQREEKLKPSVDLTDLSLQPENDVQKVRDTIDCKGLLEMIQKDSKKCLIIDCRSEEHFNESRIEFQFACNIPENLCVIGMSPTKLQQQMPNESKVYWNMRKDRSIIVFIDWFSDSFSRNSPPWYLRNLINEYDQEVEKKPEMLLLEGGYEKWLITYPMKCTNPRPTIPRTHDDLTPPIGDIEYPNLEDIVMKDLSTGNISGTPNVDRSTKSNAIISYEKNLSTTELLEKKEKLLSKSLQNENQLMQLEQDYSEVSFNKENEEDASKEAQLRYQILELDTRQKDIALEQVDIDHVLRKKDKSVDQNTSISKVEDLEQKLAKQKAEREYKKREQEALKVARENRKPADFDYKAPAKAPRTSNSSELILSPRTLNQNVVVVPHFDRAAKPIHQVTPQSFYDKQDFMPVYQKTVRTNFINMSCKLLLVSSFRTCYTLY